MIGDVLDYIRTKLNAHIVSDNGDSAPAEERVVFVGGDNMDPLKFKLGTISILLSNVEQENTVRSATPFRRKAADGNTLDVYPSIRLNLYALFVCNYKNYTDSLDNLSKVIRFFQGSPVFSNDTNPDLPQSVEKIFVQMATLPHSQQNEVWSALRTTYHPSVMYCIKTIIFEHEGAQGAKQVDEVAIAVRRKEGTTVQ